MLTNLLQSIDVSVGVYSLSGLLNTNAHHLRKWGHSFNHLAVMLPAYDPDIQGDANNADRRKDELLYAANIKHQHLIKAVEQIRPLSFQAVIEETWILPLKDASTYYNKVTLHQLLEKITVGSGGLEATNIILLIKQMMDFWNSNPPVP